MLDALISSKTRLKLLVRFFLNPEQSAHLRGLAEDFAESTNAIRVELNRLEVAGILISSTQRNKKIYRANPEHPLYTDLSKIVRKSVGIDQIVDAVINRIGNLHSLYLTGDYARGKDSGVIDLIFVGEVSRSFLTALVERAEVAISKKIKYVSYSVAEWENKLLEKASDLVLIWQSYQPTDVSYV